MVGWKGEDASGEDGEEKGGGRNGHYVRTLIAAPVPWSTHPTQGENSPLRLGWVMAPAHLVTPARDVGPASTHPSLPRIPPSRLQFCSDAMPPGSVPTHAFTRPEFSFSFWICALSGGLGAGGKATHCG